MLYSWIRSFHYAAKHQSIARAADELNVAPSAVSKQVGSLEKHYKIQLFERSTNRIALTPVGQTLKAETNRFFECEYAIRNVLEKTNNRGKDTVCIGIQSAGLIKFALQEVSLKFPRSLFRLTTDNQAVLNKLFVKGKLDVLIAQTRPNQEGMKGIDDLSTKHFLSVDKLTFVSDRETAEKLSLNPTLENALSNFPFVVRTRGSLTRSIFDELCLKMDIRPRIHMEVSSKKGLLDMVELGAGVGIALGFDASDGSQVRKLPIRTSDAVDSIISVENHFYQRHTVRNVKVVSALLAALLDTDAR